MNIDLDDWFAEWNGLRPRIIAMLEDYEARKANPPAPSPIAINAPALPGKEAMKEALESGRSLDDVGAMVGLLRVSKATGHGFDEDNASYRKRLLSDIIGWSATEAMPQSFMMIDLPAEEQGRIVSPQSLAELDGILNTLEPTDGVYVEADGSVTHQEQADGAPPKEVSTSGDGGSAEKIVDNSPPAEQVKTAAEATHEPAPAEQASTAALPPT